MKGERKEQSIEQWAEDMASPAPDFLKDHLRTVAHEIEGPNRLNVIAGRAHHWHAPGLLLLGDAAHPMSPIRAQGINLALRDCVVAANHLVGPLKQRDAKALDLALAGIQQEREPEIKRSQLLQHRDTRGIGTWYAPVLIGLAKTIGPAMGKYAWAQNAWLDQQKDLRFGSTTVTLRC
jgi:2-polyprenyl-6-methoxyphenol hydroxylase-like FAD-dependent oxidoreductase